ncbi:MAG: hypothetical protein HY692_07240 [Cyanobacteria bacterium NC_groundwater_1444_Ag_S-0.65um_54_12]|nr:hypothetical protein [Cyanobacteria bacterium NC_groundwater_1444_Ag_S-0.65um_54_12]
MSRINEPPPIGPHHYRSQPVEAHQKQAGGTSSHDSLGAKTATHADRAEMLPGATSVDDNPPGAYLFIIGMVLAMLLAGAWWGGQMVILGIGLGWVTAVLLWIIRKDLAKAFRNILG